MGKCGLSGGGGTARADRHVKTGKVRPIPTIGKIVKQVHLKPTKEKGKRPEHKKTGRAAGF